MDAEFWRRFWQKVQPAGECWIWTGSLGSHGYGQVNVDGRPVLVHRLICGIVHGLLPGQDAMHKCDVKPCCRPAHLEPGTRSQNIQDAYTRGLHQSVRKTHCHQGHLLAEYRGRQVCWACRRERTRHWRAISAAARQVQVSQ